MTEPTDEAKVWWCGGCLRGSCMLDNWDSPRVFRRRQALLPEYDFFGTREEAEAEVILRRLARVGT